MTEELARIAAAKAYALYVLGGLLGLYSIGGLVLTLLEYWDAKRQPWKHRKDGFPASYPYHD